MGVVALPPVLIQFNFSSGFKSMLKEFMGLKSVAEKCRNGSTQQMDSGRGYFSTPTDLIVRFPNPYCVMGWGNEALQSV